MCGRRPPAPPRTPSPYTSSGCEHGWATTRTGSSRRCAVSATDWSRLAFPERPHNSLGHPFDRSDAVPYVRAALGEHGDCVVVAAVAEQADAHHGPAFVRHALQPAVLQRHPVSFAPRGTDAPVLPAGDTAHEPEHLSAVLA